MRTYTTSQVARAVGIDKATLLRWLRAGKLPEPRKVSIGHVDARLWAPRDVGRVRKYKQENYRKGRGRKPKPKR